MKSSPISVANARVVVHLQDPWQNSSSPRYSLSKEGNKSIVLKESGESSAARRTLEYDAVYEPSASCEEIADYETIQSLGTRVLAGGNAAVAMFGLDSGSLYNRQAVFSQILTSLGKTLATSENAEEVTVSCCFIACTDSKMINMLNERPINLQKPVVLDSMMVAMTPEELDAKISEGSSLPYFAVLRFEHTSSSAGTGYLLLADWGNPILSGNVSTTAADVSRFVQSFRTAASNMSQTRFAGDLYPTQSVLASLLSNFFFGNTMTTYIIDVQTQHTGTELELLEGMLFGETLRKIRTLQTNNFVDPRLQQTLSTVRKLKADIDALEKQVVDRDGQITRAATTEEELRNKLHNMSLDNERLTSKVSEVESAAEASKKKSEEEISKLTADLKKYKEESKQNTRLAGLKESELQQEISDLRSQLATSSEEVRRSQTGEVAAKNRSEMLELQVQSLEQQLQDATQRSAELANNIAADEEEIESLRAQVAAANEQAKAAAAKTEQMQTANQDLNKTVSELRHQIQLMEIDNKSAQKDVQMSARENQIALREREAENKVLERQVQTLEKEIEMLRRGNSDRNAKSSNDTERESLLAEITRLRNVVSQGPSEVGKLDAVAKAAQDEFERINAARKADKERWKAEKQELMKRLDGLEGDLKKKAAVPEPAPVAAPVKATAAPAKKKQQRKAKDSSSSSSSSESEAEAPQKKTKAPKKAPKPKATKPAPAAEPEATPYMADQDSAEMELDSTPVGGIISTKKPARDKTAAPKKAPKEKSVLQAVKRKGLDADEEPKDDEPAKTTKKTKITLTKKDASGSKKPETPTLGSQENLSQNAPSITLTKPAAEKTAGDTTTEAEQATPTESMGVSLPLPPGTSGAPSLPLPPKSALPGGGPRLGAGMVDPRKLQAILAGFNMDKLKSLK